MFGKGVLELSSTFVWLSLGAISGLALKHLPLHHRHQHMLAHAAEGTNLDTLTLYSRRTWLHVMAWRRGQGRVVWHLLVRAGWKSQSLKWFQFYLLFVTLPRKRFFSNVTGLGSLFDRDRPKKRIERNLLVLDCWSGVWQQYRRNKLRLYFRIFWCWSPYQLRKQWYSQVPPFPFYLCSMIVLF